MKQFQKSNFTLDALDLFLILDIGLLKHFDGHLNHKRISHQSEVGDFDV